MSFQFGNRSAPYNCNSQNSQNQGNYYQQNRSMQMQGGFGGYQQPSPQSYNMGNPNMNQQSYQMPTPNVSILPQGQSPDPNMKVIKLNWGDLLGGNGANAAQGLKVAMMGANGDVGGSASGLKCTFNGQVPQGMPVHVMQINPYASMGLGPQNGRN